MTIAEEARRRGYRVVLGEKNLIRNLCWMFSAPPGIILDKCGQTSRSRPILDLKSRGFKYVVLDEEGIFFSHSNRLPDSSDLVLFNSDYQRRLSNLDAPSSNVVGNPRLHPKGLLPYLQGEIIEIKQRYGDFVLICGAFDPVIKTSYELPEEAEFDPRLRKMFFEIIARLSKSIPIVYRPHPSDDDEFASQISQMVPVERRFTILPWIAASKLVVNSKCTSSLDAIRLGIPSATLSVKSLKHAKVSGLSRRFYDVESICRYVESDDYGLSLPASKKSYVSLISGPENSLNKILDRLDKIPVPEVSRFRFIKFAANITSAVNRVVYGKAMSGYIRTKYGNHTYPDRFPGFTSYLGGHLVLSNN